MNEEKENHIDSNISEEINNIETPSSPFASQEYIPQQHQTPSDVHASEDSAQFLPDILTEAETLSLKKEFAEVSPKEQEEARMFAADVIAISAESESSNVEVRHAAIKSTLGTAFAVAPEGEIQEEDVSRETPTVEPFWRRTIHSMLKTAGRGARVSAIAATLGIATLAPMKNAEAGFFDQLVGANVQQTLNKVDRMMRGKQDLENVNQQQENMRLRIDQLDQEKADLIRQTSGNIQVENIQNVGENKARTVETEANYKAQKAELRAQRAQLKADFLVKPNSSEVDQARYEAALARVDAQAARIDAQYEVNLARESVRVQATNSQIHRDESSTVARIHQIEMEQQRLQSEIQRLQVQKTQRIWDTTRDISR